MSLTGKTPLKTTVAVNDGLTPENPGNAAVHNQTRDRLNEVDTLTGQVAGNLSLLADETQGAVGQILASVTQAQIAAERAQNAEALQDLLALRGTPGLILDTDGRPAFDPGRANETPTLALIVDADGVPAYVGG